MKWGFVPQKYRQAGLPLRQRRRERTGTFKDRLISGKRPSPADRGDDHFRLRAWIAIRRLFIFGVNSQRGQGVERAWRRPTQRILGKIILGNGYALEHHPAPAAPERTSAARRRHLLESLEGKRGHPRLKSLRFRQSSDYTVSDGNQQR